jgi:molybdopterin-synthase adenylyltransferase
VRRPRVKPEQEPYRLADGGIHVGGQCAGIAAEIEDPTGSVWTLLQAMDGSRDADQIVAVVMDQHPEESPQVVQEAIDDLIASGYVEDAGAPDPPELSEREKDRYSRSRSFFAFADLIPRSSPWEPQLALRRARVHVVGMGGVGSHAALALAASGVGRLHCVDRDVVELSNLNRQLLFTESDIGRAKAEVVVERLRERNSDIEITGERAEITGPGDLAVLAAQCDVLVLGADHPREIANWTNRACLETGTPWVDVSYRGPLVAATLFWPGQGACWSCLDAALHGADARERVDDPAPPMGNAVMMPSAGMAGYQAAHFTMAALTGSPPLVPGRIYTLNMITPDAAFGFETPPRAHCPDCGTLAKGGEPPR